MTSLTLAAEPDYWWTRAANLSNLPGRSFQATMARDPGTGDIFVAWTDDGTTAQEEILGRRWDRAIQGWQPVENLSQSQVWQRDGGPALIFDDQGTGLLIWTRTYAASQGAPADGHDVLWRTWNGTIWFPEGVLLHGASYLPGSPGSFGLIPVATPNAILLFIIDGTGYKLMQYQDNAWTELVPWNYTDLNVALTQIISDDQGLLHAAAFGKNSTQWGDNKWFYDAYYLTYDGKTWRAPLNLSSTTGVANDIGMAFDNQGRLHFLWSDPKYRDSFESLKSAIWERILDNGTWSPNAEIAPHKPSQAINGFSLTSDVSDTLHLAWSEGLIVDYGHTDLDIYYRTGDGVTWGAEEKVYTSTADSRFPIVVVGDTNANITWQEEFWAGGPLYDQEVYFSRQISGPPPDHQAFLPLVSK